MFKNFWLAMVALAAAPAFAQTPAGENPKPDNEKEKIRVELRTPPSADSQVQGNSPFFADAKIGAVAPAGEYWIGIECYPVLPALRAQLNLPEGQGLLVEAVAKESPALRAGIERHDILLRAGDKPLAAPEDLVAVVQAAKETKLKIELIRGGKPMSLEVTPAKRPAPADVLIGRTPSAADRDLVQKWLESIVPGAGALGAVPGIQFRVFGPGAIVSGNSAALQSLPANLSISISKQGDQPAKITVKRNDEQWELTEKDLDKLPADIRPHVEAMLGGGALGALKAIDLGPKAGAMPLPSPPQSLMPIQPFPSPIDPRLEQRLDEMNRRMERLFQMMEEMSGARPAPEKKP